MLPSAAPVDDDRDATAALLRASWLLPTAAAAAFLLGVAPGQLPAQDAARDSAGRAGLPAPPSEPDSRPLVTDRPDFTESTASVEPGRLQLESGVTLTRRDGADGQELGEILLRVGLAGPLELRVAPGSYVVVDGPGGGVEGWSDPSVGAKATLLEAAGAPPAVPSVAVLASTSLPLGHGDVSPAGIEPEAVLALGWEVGDRASAGANVKYVRALRDGRRHGRTVASVAAGFAATARLGTYLELYSTRAPDTPDGDADVVNGGVTLLLGADVQLDARVGAGLGDGPDLLLGLGVSVRR